MTREDRREGRRTAASAGTLARAVEGLREGFVLTDAQLDEPGPRILHVNAAFLRMTGYSEKEVLGRSPRFLQGPQTDRRELARLRRCLEAGERFEGQAINYRKNGEPFTMSWYVEPVRDPEGRITHFFAVQREIDGPEEEVTSKGARRQILSQLPEGVVIFSPLGRVRYVNDAYLSWSELSHDEVMRRRVWKLPGAPEGLRELRWARRMLGVPREWKREYPVSGTPRNRSQRFVYVNVFPIRPSNDSWRPGDTATPGGPLEGTDGAGDDGALEYLALVRDVTELHRLRSIAEAQNFHDNLGMVFSGVRHELGNPVNSIKTALQVVRDHLETMPQDKLSSYLERMAREVGRLEYMLRSLRAYSLYDRPRLEQLDIREFLEGFRPLAESAMEGQRAHLKMEIGRDADTVWADPQALHQVLLNLISNAGKAVRRHPDGRVVIRADRSGDHCLLTVEDNGEGIPPETLPHVFKPFYTTTSDGTGLGLAICRHLLSLMRASIDLSSSAHGTRASILLDRQKP